MSGNLSKDDLLLKHFILEMRSRKSRDLYYPKYRCDNDNYIHSDYVYMRSFLNKDADLIVESHTIQSCNSQGYDLPCIKLPQLNHIIYEDNEMLEEWIEEIQDEIDSKKSNEKYQEMKKNPVALAAFGYNRDYNESFLDKVKNAYASYKGLKYNKDNFSRLSQNCVNINYPSFFYQYKKIINTIGNKRDLGYRSAEYDFSALTDFAYGNSAAISNQQLKKSRDMLQRIIRQITSIEMKTQINKTKLTTLVQQYGVLKQIKNNFDNRISMMQNRITELNRKRSEADAKMEDLRSQIRRLKRSKENLEREIVEIKRENNLNSLERKQKIKELMNVRRDLEEENFNLKKKMAQVNLMKKSIEEENKKMQKKLKEQKTEATKTEKQLSAISNKLETLDAKVEKNKPDAKLLQTDELSVFKTNMEDLLKENEQKLKQTKSSKKLKSNSSFIPIDDEDFDLDESPSPVIKRSRVKRSRGRPKKKRGRPKKTKDLDLEFEEEKPKRKTRKPRKKRSKRLKNKDITVRVKRKRGRKKKVAKDEDEDDFIFNFSLRNMM